MKKIRLIFTLVLTVAGTVSAQKAIHTFELGDNDFLLDGKPLVMVAGEMHYPRIPKEAWETAYENGQGYGN